VSAALRGYYEDDEDGCAVVYLREPFVSDPVLLPRGALQKIDTKSAELEKWKRRYPVAREVARGAVKARVRGYT
jgi:hypothetical protein